MRSGLLVSVCLCPLYLHEETCRLEELRSLKENEERYVFDWPVGNFANYLYRHIDGIQEAVVYLTIAVLCCTGNLNTQMSASVVLRE